MGEGRTFAFDEWMLVSERHSWTVHDILSAHFGHLYAIPIAIYIAVFHVFGLDHPIIFDAVRLSIHISVAALLWIHVRRRHGDIPAIATAMIVLLMGAGAQNILWGFQIGLTASVALFLLALLCIDRARATSSINPYRLACLATALSVMSSSIGLSTLATILAITILSRDRRRTWWVGVIPLIGYIIWYQVYGVPTIVWSNLRLLPRWILSSAAGAAGGIFNAPVLWGAVGIAACVVGFAYRLYRHQITLRACAGIIFVLSFWVSTGLTRAQYHLQHAGRYQYVSIVALLLAIWDCAPESRSVAQWRKTLRSIALPVVAVIAIWCTSSLLRTEDRLLRDYGFGGQPALATLTAYDLAHDRFPPGTTIYRWLGYPMLTLDGYLQATHQFHSTPALSIAQLERASETSRQEADRVLLAGRSITIEPSPDLTSICAQPLGPGAQITVAGGHPVDVLIARTTLIRLSRFSDAGLPLVGNESLEAGQYRITAEVDSADTPWRVLFGNGDDVSVCG